MTAHLTTAGLTDTDSINGNDIAYRAQVTLFGAQGTGRYVVYTNTSYVSYFNMDERNNANNIWDSHAIFPPPPTGYSEAIWVYVAGGSQSAGDAASYYKVFDRATTDAWCNDVKYAQGWYGGDSFAMRGTLLTTTSSSGHAPRDRGLYGQVKRGGGGSAVLSLMMLEQKIYYT